MAGHAGTGLSGGRPELREVRVGECLTGRLFGRNGIDTLTSGGWCRHHRRDSARIMLPAGHKDPAARFGMHRSGSCCRRLQQVAADADESGHR